MESDARAVQRSEDLKAKSLENEIRRVHYMVNREKTKHCVGNPLTIGRLKDIMVAIPDTMDDWKIIFDLEGIEWRVSPDCERYNPIAKTLTLLFNILSIEKGKTQRKEDIPKVGKSFKVGKGKYTLERRSKCDSKVLSRSDSTHCNK